MAARDAGVADVVGAASLVMSEAAIEDLSRMAAPRPTEQEAAA
jgi:hypothetical protein